MAEVWARYTLRTDDRVLVGVTNAGLIVPQPDGSLYARTSPQFVAPRGPLVDGEATAARIRAVLVSGLGA